LIIATYFVAANFTPGMPEISTRNDVKVETIIVLGGAEPGLTGALGFLR
jgi:hypothetical protein